MRNKTGRTHQNKNKADLPPHLFYPEPLLSSVGVMNRLERFITALLVFYILSSDPAHCNYCVLLHMHMFYVPHFVHTIPRRLEKAEGVNTCVAAADL